MKKNKYIQIVTLLSALIVTACLEEPKPDDSKPSQLFRPISFVANVDVVTVSFNWAPIKDASYLLEVSRDSFQFERELSAIPVDGVANLVLEDLRSQSRYSARIKSVSKVPGVKDSDYQIVGFVTGLENIFFAIDSSGVTETSVDLSWEPEKKVTSINVLKAEQLVRTISLAEEEVLAGHLMIDKLEPGTDYSFRIYNGEVSRGSVTVKTLSE